MMLLPSPDIDPALLELVSVPIEERMFRLAPKGGRLSFIAFEDELLQMVRENLPRELAPYLVTFVKDDLLQYDQSKEQIEKLDDFQGWSKNMTFRIWVWRESTYRRVTSHPCKDLTGLVGSLALAIEHCPLELFGQNKIIEHESRIWAYGSVHSYYGNTRYINAEGTAMYGRVRRGLRKVCSRPTIFVFAKGEEAPLKGTRMSEKAAHFLAQFPGGHHFRPGKLPEARRKTIRSRRRF